MTSNKYCGEHSWVMLSDRLSICLFVAVVPPECHVGVQSQNFSARLACINICIPLLKLWCRLCDYEVFFVG